MRLLVNSAFPLCLFVMSVAAWGAEPISPIPNDMKLDQQKVALGDLLFHDTRLSKDNSLSCATCHDLKRGGTDQLPVSVGFGGAKGPINSPTVFNSGFSFRQFWDGRAATLEEQVDGPTHADKEMASNWKEIVGKLKKDSALVKRFKKVFGGDIEPKFIRSAIAEFERSLVTPDSDFDLFLKGNKSAMSKSAQDGYALFKSYGCVACHQGVAMGGNMYQKFGVIGDYFADRGNLTEVDNGRFNVTKNPADKHVFKVPTLRNIEKTAPYFHDASAKTLEEAVATMAKYQLGRKLKKSEMKKIVDFLKSLTGKYKGKKL